MTPRFLCLLSLVAAGLLGFGCVSPDLPIATVEIKATARSGADVKTKFYVLPGANVTDQKEYEEASDFLISGLMSKGFTLARPDDADLVIYLDYSTRTTKEKYTTSSPILGTVPGPVSNVNLVTRPLGSASGPMTTTGTVTNQEVLGVVGQKTILHEKSFIAVEAQITGYDAKAPEHFR